MTALGQLITFVAKQVMIVRVFSDHEIEIWVCLPQSFQGQNGIAARTVSEMTTVTPRLSAASKFPIMCGRKSSTELCSMSQNRHEMLEQACLYPRENR